MTSAEVSRVALAYNVNFATNKLTNLVVEPFISNRMTMSFAATIFAMKQFGRDDKNLSKSQFTAVTSREDRLNFFLYYLYAVSLLHSIH